MAQKKNKYNLIQFTFDDWRRGNVPDIIKLGKTLIIEKDKTGRDTGKSWYEEISLVVYNEIKEAQKIFYWEEVDHLLNGKPFLFDGKKHKTSGMIQNFEKLLKQTDDKEGLFKEEINKLKYLFGLKKKADSYLFPRINNTQLSRFRSLYSKLIRRDKRDYSIVKVRACYKENGTKYVDPDFIINIQVEASFKYLQWLKKEKLKPTEDPSNIKTLKDNLDAKEISKLFKKESSFYELVLAFVRKDYFIINKEGKKWKITISDKINKKATFLASMHFYLNEEKNSLTTHTYTHAAEIFVDFFNLNMTHNKFKERFKPKYKTGRVKYDRYFTFMNTN